MQWIEPGTGKSQEQTRKHIYHWATRACIDTRLNNLLVVSLKLVNYKKGTADTLVVMISQIWKSLISDTKNFPFIVSHFLVIVSPITNTAKDDTMSRDPYRSVPTSCDQDTVWVVVRASLSPPVQSYGHTSNTVQVTALGVLRSENSHTWPRSPISPFWWSLHENIHSTINKVSKIKLILCHPPNPFVCHPSS